MRFWRAEEKIIAGLKQIMRKETQDIEIKMDGYVDLIGNVWYGMCEIRKLYLASIFSLLCQWQTLIGDDFDVQFRHFFEVKNVLLR